MPIFTKNAQRRDPYKNFKFRVRFEDRIVAGVSKVSALKRTIEVIEHREGGDPSSARKQPGKATYEGITLERGVTHDLEFVQWANKAWDFEGGAGKSVSLEDFRRSMHIDLLNEAGQLARSWELYDCWVSEYQALGELDANGNAVALEMLKIEHHGFVLAEIPEPGEPSFTTPVG